MPQDENMSFSGSKRELFLLILATSFNQGIEEHKACGEEDDAADKAQEIKALKTRCDKEKGAYHKKHPSPQAESHLSFSVLIGHDAYL